MWQEMYDQEEKEKFIQLVLNGNGWVPSSSKPKRKPCQRAYIGSFEDVWEHNRKCDNYALFTDYISWC